MASKQPNRVAQFILMILAFIVLFLHGCSQQEGLDGDRTVTSSLFFDPVSDRYDWQPQDWTDSQAITNVLYDPACRCLVASGNFRGGDKHSEKGEVYLDLRFVPELEGKVPLDLSKTKIEVELEVPGGFNHRFSPWERERPNGTQACGKDELWRTQYSTWTNTLRNRADPTPYHLTHRFIRSKPVLGWSDPDFDPSRIIMMCVKFGLGTGSTHTYSGPLFIKRIKFDPPILISPRPPRYPIANIFTAQDRVTIRNGAFYLNGRKFFVVGGNYRILEYAQGFGATRWWPRGNGISRHPNYVDTYLQRFENAGIKVIRVGLVKDGRVILSPEDRIIGYDETFRKDVGMLLDMAAAHDMKVEFTLLDYLIAGKTEVVNGVQVRGHERLLTDAEVSAHFIEAFLRPFLKEFGSHRALMAIDIINEPEWLISAREGGGWEEFSDQKVKAPQPVPLKALHSFISRSIGVVKTDAPSLLVTVGVSSKYAGFIAGLPVDYYALHHYPNFGGLAPYLKHVPPGMAWVLEEYPTAKTPIGPAGYLTLVKELGGAGALLWNLRPDSDEYTYQLSERDAKLAEIRDWVSANRSVALPEVAAAIPSHPTTQRNKKYSRYSPDGRYGASLVFEGQDIHYEIYDLKTGTKILKTHAQYDTPNDVKAATFSPDSKQFATAYHYGHAGAYTWIAIWSIPSGRLVDTRIVSGWRRDVRSVFESR